MDALARGRFASEVRHHRLISADSPYLVSYELAGIRDEYLWLATGRFGTGLDKILRGSQPLTLEQAAVIGHDLLAGLAAVHGRAAVHRDIKPGNVLVQDGRARLCDLGLVMPADAYTRDNQAGTGPYVAPELKDPSASPDSRSDVYSAAVTLREVLPAPVPGSLESLLARAADREAPLSRPRDAAEMLALYRRTCAEAGLVLPSEEPAFVDPPPIDDADFLAGRDRSFDGAGPASKLTPATGASRLSRRTVVSAVSAVVVVTGAATAVLVLHPFGWGGGADPDARAGAPTRTATQALAAVREYASGLPENGPGRGVGRCTNVPGMQEVVQRSYSADEQPDGPAIARVALHRDPDTSRACAKLIRSRPPA